MLMDPKSTPVVELSPRPGKGPLRKQKSPSQKASFHGQAAPLNRSSWRCLRGPAPSLSPFRLSQNRQWCDRQNQGPKEMGCVKSQFREKNKVCVWGGGGKGQEVKGQNLAQSVFSNVLVHAVPLPKGLPSYL